jgi:hypothetical protein
VIFDETWLSLNIADWRQTISHGEGFLPYQMAAEGRTAEDEKLEFGPDGARELANMRVSITLVKGQPEKALPRGIGTLGYYPPTEPTDEFEGGEEFCGGWFWLPEDSFNEIWAQVRENRYDTCLMSIGVAPVESAPFAFIWDFSKNKLLFITQVSVIFRKSKQT